MTYPPPGGPGQQPFQQPWPGQTAGAAPARAGTSGLAVFSLVLGVLALLGLCGASVLSGAGFGIGGALMIAAFVSITFGAAAMFAGVAARRQIRTGAATGSGLATTGLVLGIISMSLVVVVLVVLLAVVQLDT